MPNQFHEYNEQEFNSLPWANDFMNADPHSNEFSNAMAEADKYYGPDWTNKQLESWGIQFENEIENGSITPEQLPENSPIQKEAEQLTDINPNNDEVKNNAVEDFIKQMESAAPSKQEQDEAAYRQQLNDMQLADDINSNIDNYDMLHFTPEEDKPTEYMWAPGSFMRKDIKDSVNLINSYPTSQKRAALELLARINSGDIDSYEDMLKANPWMDEAMYEAISSIASNDNRSGKIPVISKSSMKRNKAKLENYIEKHPEEASQELPEGSDIQQEAIQAIDGGRDAEVDNKIAEDFVKNSGLLGDRNLNLEGTAKEITDDYIDDEAEAIVESDEEESIDEEADKIVESAFPVIPTKSLGPDIKLSGTDEIERKLTNAGSSFGRAFSHPSAGGGGLSSGSVKDASIETPKASIAKPNMSGKLDTSDAATNVVANASRGVTSTTQNGGTFGSGSVNKTGNSLLNVHKVSLPSGEANNQAEAFDFDISSLKDSHIRNLEERIKSLDPEIAEHFKFDIKYKHVEYNHTPLDELSGGQLKEVEEILNAIGA